jgi:RHS repeat-associated protein
VGGGAGAPSYYGFDGLGSVRFLTDAAGAITDTYDYDAWGNLVNYTAVTPNSKLYRGDELDGDLGLYYLRARYFDPLTGRFLTTDPESGLPAEPRSQHPYLYAGADPVNRIDPTGRQDSGDQRGGAGLLIFDIRAGGYVAFAPAPLTWPVLRLSSCYLSLSMGGLPQDSEELIQRLEGCMAGGDKCGDSCRRPVYDPIPWNDPGTRSADRPVWGPRFTNNCYSYAINQPEQPRNERYKRQPGESSGRPVSDFGNCKAVKNAAMRDGLKTAHADDCCPQGYFRVKLFAGQSVHPPGFTGKAFPDYHWYRQDANCMWSSKHGLGPVDAQLKESEVQTDARSWGYNPCANMCAPIR